MPSPKEGWAAELRREAVALLNGVGAARGLVEPSVWEGHAAGQADEFLANGMITVQGAADDLELIAAKLARQADGLRAEVEELRRRAGLLQAELDGERRAGRAV